MSEITKQDLIERLESACTVIKHLLDRETVDAVGFNVEGAARDEIEIINDMLNKWHTKGG